MPLARKIKTTVIQGTENTGGSAFDDKVSLTNINTAVVTRIVITYDDYLRSIALHYADKAGTVRGSSDGTSVVLDLAKGEFVTAVEGTSSGGVMSKLKFETNKGQIWGPWGKTTHTSSFFWNQFPPGMGLLALNGTSSSHILTLQGTFGMYYSLPLRPANIKYEKYLDSEPASVPVPQSKFHSDLMSAPITLIIGFDKAVFHAAQDVLCRLPFFQAALKGAFREAPDHKITMPEDDPACVAALIEFLYTSNYTYPYRTISESIEEGEAPTTNLEEGAYHVGVYATAFKYDCQGLVDVTLEAFMFVLGELKGVDVLRLWSVAYSKDLLLSAVQDREGILDWKNGLTGLLKEIFIEYPAEMERVTEEYPILVHDLLQLVVCNQ